MSNPLYATTFFVVGRQSFLPAIKFELEKAFRLYEIYTYSDLKTVVVSALTSVPSPEKKYITLIDTMWSDSEDLQKSLLEVYTSMKIICIPFDDIQWNEIFLSELVS